MTGSVVVPSDVRINGVSVLTTGGVKIHKMTIQPAQDMATVTITLVARRVTIAAEGDLDSGTAADPG